MIERILQQSESYRRKVAVLVTFIVAIAIFSAWAIIAGYNIRTTSRVTVDEETKTAQQFKQTLPSLSQEQKVTTELEKQQTAASAKDVISEEEKESFLDKLFNK